MKILTLLQAAVVFPLLTSSAFACSTCDSALAQAVREEVFGPGFWSHVGITILPFAIVFVITAAVCYGLPPHHRKTTGNRSS